jgi:hypothetical protein
MIFDYLIGHISPFKKIKSITARLSAVTTLV